jgi:hypothetical protein
MVMARRMNRLPTRCDNTWHAMTLKRLSTPARMDEFECYSITVGFKAAHVSWMLTSGFFVKAAIRMTLYEKTSVRL